jgi:peptide chain release factor 1
MTIREMLDRKLARFEELERAMSDPQVLADSSRVANVAREHGLLARLATRYRRFKQVNKEIAEFNELAESNDPEEREMASLELPS